MLQMKSGREMLAVRPHRCGSEFRGTKWATATDISRIVFSFLVFAKRPLLSSELIEGIAMTRTSNGEDINKKRFLERAHARIQTACRPFIRLVEPEKGESFFLLNHDSVRQFLLDNSENADDSLVDSSIIRDCCMKYLSQPKYARFLQICDEKVLTASGEDVSNHSLGMYCAKYWHEHFDNADQDAVLKQNVEEFLWSSNFATCMQMQSLYVLGHFVMQFNPVTGDATTIIRSLPQWLKNTDMFKQHADFLSEWAELLLLGLSSGFKGELDRCFWNALHPHNFLCRNMSRYDAILLSKVERDEGNYFVSFPPASTEGAAVVVCHVKTHSNSHVSKDHITDSSYATQVIVERWTLNTHGSPTLRNCIKIDLDQDECTWNSSATVQDEQTTPSLSSSLTQAPPIKMYGDGSILRIGHRILRLSEHGDLTMLPIGLARNERHQVWADIQTRGDLTVTWRRDTPKVKNITPKPREQARQGELRRRRDIYDEYIKSSQPLPKDIGRHFGKFEIEDDDATSLYEYSDDLSTGSNSDSSEDEESASSCSDSDNEKEEYDDSEDQGSETESTDDLSESQFQHELDYNVAISQDVEIWEEESDDEEPDWLSEDDDGEPETVRKDLIFHQNEDFEDVRDRYPVKVNGGVYCDWCGKAHVTEFLRCNICFSQSLDLCFACHKNGAWCLDFSHKLYEFRAGQCFDVRTRDTYRPRQHFEVYQTKGGVQKRIFSFDPRVNHPLGHASPAIHPTLPLVALPVTPRRLLLFDTKSKNKAALTIDFNRDNGQTLYHA